MMYKKILVALENSDTDAHLIAHVGELASLLGSEVLLVHVADGFAARNYKQLKLAPSEEMQDDQRYLDKTVRMLEKRGIKAESRLEVGNPPEGIVKVAKECGCDLIAMSSHGHRLIGDLVYGSTIEPVRHNTHVPILTVRKP
jgi:manganese transport protein